MLDFALGERRCRGEFLAVPIAAENGVSSGMKLITIAFAFLAVVSASAAAQFPARVQPGVRVRVWLPEPHPQENTPWRRQLLRATVSGVENDALRLTVPGAEGTLSVQRSAIRRLDVSQGRSRIRNFLERGFGGAVVGAITGAAFNDPQASRWPDHDSRWEAAGYGALGGFAIGGIIGLVAPTERWRRIRL